MHCTYAGGAAVVCTGTTLEHGILVVVANYSIDGNGCNLRDISIVCNTRERPVNSIPFWRKSVTAKELLVRAKVVGGPSVVEQMEDGVVVPSLVFVYKLSEATSQHIDR
jgi:hypothetical protein